MSDFWGKFNSGQISNEELFRQLFFFEKAVGGAEYVGFSDLLTESKERIAVKKEGEENERKSD